MSENRDVILHVEDLSVAYRTRRGHVLAVNNITLDLRQGDTLALIGESGSGKTTLGLALVRMLAKSAQVTSGQIIYTRNGQSRSVLGMSKEHLRAFRWQDCAMVFQGSQNAFNPVLRIRDQFLDTARAHGKNDAKWVEQRTLELFKLVRLDPERVYNAYPHELSGGMKQRTLLALGALLDPQVMILDEPTTALDILTQRTVIEVLNEMHERLNFSIIFISHDLGIAAELANRVGTMYAGEMVELGSVDQLFYRPLHPYTLGLLQSIPRLSNPYQDELKSIPGEPPNMIDPPSGCKFHPRCAFATDKCAQQDPPFVEYEPGHMAACWHTDKVIEAHQDLYKAQAPKPQNMEVPSSENEVG
ncbi:MAG: peptide ABC transporter ATP-binding protein [Anaerolineaceae bacterium]|nr:peptide ABC transporter ATP-binding protein [Anaerolineaceae bacterium]